MRSPMCKPEQVKRSTHRNRCVNRGTVDLTTPYDVEMSYTYLGTYYV
jgi:hypothetical protein